VSRFLYILGNLIEAAVFDHLVICVADPRSSARLLHNQVRDQ
jgi:hypothetical protein